MDPFETIDRIIEEIREECERKEELGREDQQRRKQLLDLYDARIWLEAEVAGKDQRKADAEEKARRLREDLRALGDLCDPIFDPSIIRWIPGENRKSLRRWGERIKKTIRAHPGRVRPGPPKLFAIKEGRPALDQLIQDAPEKKGGGRIVKFTKKRKEAKCLFH